MTSSHQQSPPRDLEARYRRVRALGTTQSSRTSLARDTKTDRSVVLKELRVSSAEDWKEIELFERGAQTLSALDHPQIPALIDAFYDEESARFFLVQEFIEGVDLKEKLQRDGAFSPDQTRQFLREMVEILEYLHGFSPPIIHRDIKPSNILMRPDGSYALIDFDLVQTVIPDQVGGSTIAGTTGYMPPEQLLGRAQPKSDLYALGAAAVHLLTGVSPGDLPFRRGALDLGELHIPDEKLRACLLQLLQAQPALRPDLAALREELKAPSAPAPGALTQLPTTEVEDYLRPKKYDHWLEITLEGQMLGDQIMRVELAPTPHNAILVLPAWSAFWALAASGLIAMVSSSLSQTTLIIGAIAFVIAWLVCWSNLKALVFETGIRQTLILSSAGIKLEEQYGMRWWDRSPRRDLKSWFIPRNTLKSIRLHLAEEYAEQTLAAPGDQPDALLLSRTINAASTRPSALLFSDKYGEEYVFGEELLRESHGPNYTRRVEDMRAAADAALSYLLRKEMLDEPALSAQTGEEER